MKANPYVITFSDEADGGPTHVLSLLLEYGVDLYKNGNLIVSGMIVSVDEFNNTVGISQFVKDDEGREFLSSDISVFNIYEDFDEVMYQ